MKAPKSDWGESFNSAQAVHRISSRWLKDSAFGSIELVDPNAPGPNGYIWWGSYSEGTWTVPEGVEVIFVSGAGGGSSDFGIYAAAPQLGTYAIPVTPGETLSFHVGSHAWHYALPPEMTAGGTGIGVPHTGGWPDGGPGATDGEYDPDVLGSAFGSSYGGGGSTKLFRGGTTIFCAPGNGGGPREQTFRYSTSLGSEWTNVSANDSISPFGDPIGLAPVHRGPQLAAAIVQAYPDWNPETLYSFYTPGGAPSGGAGGTGAPKYPTGSGQRSGGGGGGGGHGGGYGGSSWYAYRKSYGSTSVLSTGNIGGFGFPGSPHVVSGASLITAHMSMGQIAPDSWPPRTLAGPNLFISWGEPQL